MCKSQKLTEVKDEVIGDLRVGIPGEDLDRFLAHPKVHVKFMKAVTKVRQDYIHGARKGCVTFGPVLQSGEGVTIMEEEWTDVPSKLLQIREEYKTLLCNVMCAYALSFSSRSLRRCCACTLCTRVN